MKFSIITSTYNRPEKLKRAVESVLAQRYENWEMIIVNDSPENQGYTSITPLLVDPRIRYFPNETNKGVNYTRNRALDITAEDSDWIIFLDDDDYFGKDTLLEYSKLIQEHTNAKWIVTDRRYEDGKTITKFPKSNHYYSYIWSYLLLKRCRGDATHCIHKDTIGQTRFSKHIRQAEEWIFYYQIGLRTEMFYHRYPSTLSDGYGTTGLNFRVRSTKEQLRDFKTILKEGFSLGLLYRPTFILYLGIRLVRAFIK